MTEGSIILPDHRKLGYSVYGAMGARPVLYFHGTPSSRLELNFLFEHGINLEKYLSDARLQLIAVDRPGMGLSSFNANGSFLSFADDIIHLLRALEISHCAVLCWSGGGPYALAAAWKYPSLIKQVFIICGFSRQFTMDVISKMSRNKWYFLTAKNAPWLMEFFMNGLRKINPHRSLPQWITRLPEADYELIKTPQHLQALATLSIKEACRAGARGAVYEARLYFQNFAFQLSQIEQPVHYWWGTDDDSVIRLHAEAVERQVKNSVLHYMEGEGHLSIYIHCFKDILQTIKATTES